MITQGIIFTVPGFWILEYQLVFTIVIVLFSLLLNPNVYQKSAQGVSILFGAYVYACNGIAT